jgi:hypothetical protein
MTIRIGPILLGIVLLAGPAFSQDAASGDQSVAAELTIAAVPFAQSAPQPAVTPQQPAVLPAPHYYSRAYDVRAKIHKYASFTTLPLVGGEFVVGQSLFDSPSGAKKSAHIALGTAIGGLFAVNSVTGVWNLVQARKDPNRGHLPLIHSLLALGADAGFVATAAITPSGDDHDGGSLSAANRGTHRTMAFTSMGLATASYLVMLIGNR